MNSIEMIVDGYENAKLSLPPHKHYFPPHKHYHCDKTISASNRIKHIQGIRHIEDKIAVQSRLMDIRKVKAGVAHPSIRMLGVCDLNLLPPYLKTFNEKFDEICDFYDV